MAQPTLEEIYNKYNTGTTSSGMPISNSYGSLNTSTQTGQPTQPSAPMSAPGGKPSLSDIYNKYQSETSQQISNSGISIPTQSTLDVNNVTPETQNIFSRIGSAIKENVIDPFTSRFSNIDYNNQNIGSNLLQSGGALAGGAVDALGKSIVSTYDAVGNIPVVGQVVAPKTSETVTSALDATSKAISSAVPESTKAALSDWATQHPEAAANLGAIVDIASLVGTGRAIGLGKEALGAGLEKGIAESTVKRILQPSKNIDRAGVVGNKIIAGIPEQDLSKIKTYSQLEKTLQAQNTRDLNSVTAELLKDTTKYRLENFEINKNRLKFNPVKDAINSLKELGTKTSDTNLLAKVNDFSLKAKKGELLQNDVNELAKLLGNKQNAFSQSGTILKNTNAIKAENTRLALKEIARTGMSPDVANLDKLVSERIQVAKLAETMSNKVAKEIQKAQQSSVLKKIIGAGVGVADTITGNILTSTIRTLGKASGLTLSDSVKASQLEKELIKNLKKLQTITKAKDANQMKQFLQGVGYFGGGQIMNVASDQQTQPQ